MLVVGHKVEVCHDILLVSAVGRSPTNHREERRGIWAGGARRIEVRKLNGLVRHRWRCRCGSGTTMLTRRSDNERHTSCGLVWTSLQSSCGHLGLSLLVPRLPVLVTHTLRSVDITRVHMCVLLLLFFRQLFPIFPLFRRQ